MTEVEFHTGLEDPVAFTCRLLRKAYRLGTRVLVTAPAGRLSALDRALWLIDDPEPAFVAHARLPAAAVVLSRSLLWLATDVGLAGKAAVPAPNVLINLGADAPPSLDGLSRLIEVVGAESEERDAGRVRWRTYAAQGFAIKHHIAAG